LDLRFPTTFISQAINLGIEQQATLAKPWWERRFAFWNGRLGLGSTSETKG